MKQTITITGFEDSEDGTRTRFKTSAGWMSAFKNEGEVLIEDLKNHINRLINVEVVSSNKLNQQGKPYINIRKFYGAVVGSKTIEMPHGEIEIEEKEEVPVEKIEDKPVSENPNIQRVHADINKIKIADPTCSMYVAYAKDIFIAIVNEDQEQTKMTMKTAIELVQQARDAFS